MTYKACSGRFRYEAAWNMWILLEMIMREQKSRVRKFAEYKESKALHL